MNNCCCTGGKFGGPCSISSNLEGILLGASYDNDYAAGDNGILSKVASTLFPNFVHDIKSFPADETSDYVAIAGGSYGCRVLKRTGSGITNYAHLVGSCNRITGRTTHNVSAFTVLNQEIWIGDDNGYRYGWDQFEGLYGVAFFRKGTTTYLVTACGKNGLDLWNLDTLTLLVSGVGAGNAIFKKIAVDKRLCIISGCAGYEGIPDQYKSFGATDLFWKIASQPEGTIPTVPEKVANDYMRIWQIDLTTNSITQKGDGLRFDPATGSPTSPWTEDGGGVNDMIYLPESDVVVYSYSYHGWNLNHGDDSSPSSYDDRTNLVIGGGMKYISYNSIGDYYEDMPYHTTACGQITADDNENVYWTNIEGADGSDSTMLLGFNTSLVSYPSDAYLEFLNGYKTIWLGRSDRGNFTFGCNLNQTLEYYTGENVELASYTFVSGTSIGAVGKEIQYHCVYGNDQFDENDSITYLPSSTSEPMGTANEQRTEYFGSGATGVTMCGANQIVSLWQDGLIYQGTHYNSIDLDNFDINYQTGGGTSGSMYGKDFLNRAPTLPCSRSTATRFGPIITLSLENTHGDMGPGYYGFTTTGQGALKDAAQLLQANDAIFGKTRGIIY